METTSRRLWRRAGKTKRENDKDNSHVIDSEIEKGDKPGSGGKRKRAHFEA